MNIKRKLLTACLCVAVMMNSLVIPNINAAENNAPMQPIRLLTNDLEKPQNVEEPTFSWVVNDNDFNEIQTAYQIIVTDAVTEETAWDSGKVMSSEQSYISCGTELEEGYPYKWKVKTWDKDGLESPYSEEVEFATGISDYNWNASWISDGTGGANAAMGKHNHFWYVRGEGEIDSSKTVAKAVGYFSAEQDYNLYINGNEIGRGQSFDYASETRYQGWDITEAVKQSTDTLAVGAIVRTYGPGQGRAATDAGFIGRINVYYTDGTSTTIVTDGNWKVSQAVPFSGTSVRNGEGDFVEKYNAQNVQNGFSTKNFDDSAWTFATVLGVNTTKAITALQPELSKITNDFVKPVSVTVLDDGTTVADFGRVIPARPCITFKNGKAGNMYVIQGGYVLKNDDSIDTSSTKTQSTKMTWEYTQKDGEQTYSAWDHLAFRYLSIPACGETFTPDTFAAKIVHTDVPDGLDSTIITSNKMLNDVYEILKYSALYSIQNCFVDTPTREKGQFLQDAINISEASISTQYEREASRKAIEQFMASADRYWTGDNLGRMNSVYPNGDGARDIPDFTVNFPYWVYNYYMATGDRSFLEKAYPYVKNVSDYIARHISADTGLVTKLTGGDGNANTYMYGIVDWPAAGRFGYDWNGTKEGARTTVNMLSKRAFDVTAELAKVVGNTEDSAEYAQNASNIKIAINEKLLTAEGVYCDGLNGSGNQVSHKSQHATSYALAFNVAPEDKKSDMVAYIADMGMKQGPMTADILAKGLIAANKSAAALKLFTEPNDYGWANEVANGYTFTFESWKASSVEDSQSHGWGSTAAADILEGFAGVRITDAGAQNIEIAPMYTDLTSLDARVQTQRGEVSVVYERSDSSYHINITVPANVKAQIKLPVIGDGTYIEKNGNAVGFVTDNEYQTVTVGSGEYEFVYDGEITNLPETVVYDTSIEGIKGSVDTANKIYSYEIGRTEAISEAGNTIKDSSKYIDLTVSLGSNDSTNSSDGISFSDTSVNESNSLNDSKRYIMITPKVDGVFYISAEFPNAAANRKHRIYYKDFDSEPVDLIACTKATGTAVGSDVTSSAAVTKELEVTAGHTYVLYTYQKAGTISAMSFQYNEEPTDTPNPDIDVIKYDENSGKITSSLSGTMIICNYDKAGIVTEIAVNEIKADTPLEPEIEIIDTTRIYLWNDLKDMKPLTEPWHK